MNVFMFTERVKEAVRHNLGLSITGLLAIVMAIWLVSCASVVKSPISEGMVTRSELSIEYDAIMSKILLAEADLDRQDALKAKVTEVAFTLAEGGTLNPIGIATSLISLLGIGAAVDNRIKDRIIKSIKST